MVTLSTIPTYYYYISGTILLIIILFFIAGSFRSRRNCNHRFKSIDFVIVKDRLRLVQKCKRCGVVVHVPIPTLKQLKEVEDETREQIE